MKVNREQKFTQLFWLEYFALFIFLILSFKPMFADKCKDFLAYSATDSIVQFGIDTTGHWWAVSKDFSGGYRLIIDGNQSAVYKIVQSLAFSPDGSKWACFAKDNSQWYVLTNDTTIGIPSNEVGELAFSPDSRALIYSYKEAENEVIELKNSKINVINRTGKFYPGFNGTSISFMGNRGDGVVININGKESPLFDEIKPMGYWHDGQMVYAARNGGNWEVYKNFTSISEAYADIPEVAINVYGTVAAILAKQSSGKFVSVIFSDDYTEPLIGKPYEDAHALILHPELPMLAYIATYNNAPYVILNSTEYSGGQQTSLPFFSHDGKELCFFGCDIDCFACINGKRYPIQSQIDLMGTYAVKPGSNTFAYVTSSSMIVRDLESATLYAGMMVDQTSSPIFSWRNHRYEALGLINQRLYLMTCEI
jgi:hypothetical protein